MTAFGKFPSLEEFLVAYDAHCRQREREEEVDLSSTARIIRRRKERDIVEVDCKIARVDPADNHGTKHVLLRVELTGVLESDVDVDDDVQSHLLSHAYVLVAIQYHQPGIPGLIEGANIRVRGAWIAAARAHPVGGDRLSVLHFTHSPIGFVMVGETIYR